VDVVLPTTTLPSSTTEGVVSFKGELAGMPGTYYGLNLDAPLGKNDGTLKGVRYFEAQPQHGLFVKIGAKNVTMKRIVVALADDSFLQQPPVERDGNMSDDLLAGWGDANPFEKTLDKSLPNIADWGSPIPSSLQDESKVEASPVGEGRAGRIDEWDPDGPMATPVKANQDDDESLVNVTLNESSDLPHAQEPGANAFSNDGSFGAPPENGHVSYKGERVQTPTNELIESTTRKLFEDSREPSPASMGGGAEDPFVAMIAKEPLPVEPVQSADLLFGETQNVTQTDEPEATKQNFVANDDPLELLAENVAKAVIEEDELATVDDPFAALATGGGDEERTNVEAKSGWENVAEFVSNDSFEAKSADLLFGESGTDDPFAEKINSREGSVSVAAATDVASLFSGAADDPFSVAANDARAEQVLCEAAVLFGGSQLVVEDPFAAVSPGAVENVLREVDSVVGDAASLFGDNVKNAKVFSSPPVQSVVKASVAVVEADAGISEIPDLFGTVQDDIFAAPAPKPKVVATAPTVLPFAAPAVKQTVLPTPVLLKPLAVQAVKPAPVQSVLASPVLSKPPLSNSPSLAKAPHAVPVPVPLPVPSSPVALKTVAPKATHVFVAPPVTVPVPVKVAVPSFVQPVKAFPTAAPIFTPFAPPVLKQAAALPPPLLVKTPVATPVQQPLAQHPSVAGVSAAPMTPTFVAPVTSFAPPAARIAPPVFQQPRLPTPQQLHMPRVPSAPPFSQLHAQIPPPSPQSPAVMTMTDDLSGFDESDFLGPSQPQVAHMPPTSGHAGHQHYQQQQHQFQQPPSVQFQSAPAPEAFFPSSYGATAAPTMAPRTTYVSTATSHFMSLQASASGLDDTRPPVPIWSWGFGGRCAVMFPRHRRALSTLGVPPQAGEQLVPGAVKLLPFGKTVAAKHADLVLASSFPGPLRTKASKSQVTAWLRSRIQLLTQVYQTDPRVEVADELTLWEVLSVICEHDGDIRSGVAGGGGAPSPGQAALVSLLKSGKKDDVISAEWQTPFDLSRLAVIETLLSVGKQSEAIGEAVRGKLWPHALFLASFSPDQDMFQSVRAQFASEACASGSALRSLYLMLSGQMATLFAHAVDASAVSMDKWRESAAMLLANGSQAS
jgi:hypothetical protein